VSLTPEFLAKLGSCHDFGRAVEQCQQQPKGLLLQTDRTTSPAQFARHGIGFERSEAKKAAAPILHSS
jgi:hypothetical protein